MSIFCGSPHLKSYAAKGFPISFSNALLTLPRLAKRTIALAVDASLCIFTLWFALSLRLENWVPLSGIYAWAALASVVLALPLFMVFGFYRAIFRYAGWRALLAVARALGIYGVLFALIFTVVSVPGIPRTIGVLQPLLLLVAVGGSRVLARYWLGGMYHDALQRQQLPQVLIYGAGSAGRQLAAALVSSNEYRLLGFLDDDDRLHGNTLDGWRVYNPGKITGLIVQLGVTEILLALPSASRQRRNSILESLRDHPVHVRTLPGMADLAAGRVSLNDVRDLDIEDLLGRDPVAPHGILLNRHIRAKNVVVTGAGGSIGSELCRQILKCVPQRLLLLEQSEFALYQIHQELSALLAAQADNAATELIPLLASVQDETRLNEILAAWQPHTLYHAAAYKHVPLVEHNPAVGIKNNVWGTWACARAALKHGVENFVLISTDKAVRPTNIMGASKRLAEMVLQALANAASSTEVNTVSNVATPKTCFSMVRFGNVLGSSGSVVPLFREQIKQGGPVTLTHLDITRYFMTIPEAAQLVIQAGAMAARGDVFVLDMGQPVRIYDLAKRMIELSGFALKDADNPEGEIEIQVTGLRPGEKLYEELLIGSNPQATQHPLIMKAQEDYLPWPVLEQKLADLEQALNENDVPAIRHLMQQLVVGYQPVDDVVDWVYVAKRTAQGDNKNTLSLQKT